MRRISFDPYPTYLGEMDKQQTMDKCAQFCRYALIILNGIAVVKSVDFIIAGAALNVLRTLLIPNLSNTTIESADHSTHVTGDEIYDNTWLFMLITGPIIFLVSLLGLFGAKHKHRLSLAFFIVLQVLLIVIVIALSVTKIPAPLVSPTIQWRPLSTFILSSVLIVCALQGTMILFSMAVISSLRDQNKVEPKPPALTDRRNTVPELPRRSSINDTRRFSMR